MALYVKLYRSIWQDPDFRRLTAAAQRTYTLLISQPDISHVGILSITAGRWASFADDTTTADVLRDIDALQAARYVVTDATTEELWVRTYILHDESWRVPNGRKALVSAYGRVLSEPLRQRISTALERVGVTLDGTLTGTQQGRDAALQQQQTSAANISSSSKRDPSADPSEPTGPYTWNPAAAAAMEIFIEHRVQTSRPRNPTGLRKALSKELPDEYGRRLESYSADHPNSTAADVLRDVFKLTTSQIRARIGGAA